MATARDIVNSAIYDLGIVEPGGSVPAADASTGLDKLNSMMSGLEAEGINLLWSDLTLNSTFPLENKHRQGVEAMLAVRLSAIPAYSVSVNPEVKMMAIRGKQLLAADYKISDKQRSPDGLLNFPSQRRYR